MAEENISQKFGSKNLDKARSYFIKEVDQNELMNKKHKVCATLCYFLVLVSGLSTCILISVIAYLLGISIRITSSAIGLKIFAIISGLKGINQ